jgi:hypothetical protein
MGNMSSDDQVFQAFANASEAELAKLAEQLAPQVNGGATQAAMGTQSLVSTPSTPVWAPRLACPPAMFFRKLVCGSRPA